MTAGAGLGSSSRLARLAQGASRPRRAAGERCDLCAAPVAAEHRHLLHLTDRTLRCACRACAILFDRSTAGGGQYRLVPERYRELHDLAVADDVWERLGIPVGIAFFFHSTPAGRVVAFYPSPAGAMESRLDLGAWEAVAAANPGLAGMEPDVEALLVHRARGAREHWLVPVDACYRLVGEVRTHWRGVGGGQAVWDAIAAFFAALRTRVR
jgi:hypothetical protein